MGTAYVHLTNFWGVTYIIWNLKLGTSICWKKETKKQNIPCELISLGLLYRSLQFCSLMESLNIKYAEWYSPFNLAVWLLILQIYTGRYSPPRERENPVETLDDCLENIEVGKFVAVHLANYDKVPVIGKALEVNEDMLKIHYWKGSCKGKWRPQDVPKRRTPWVHELPKTGIILCSFSLTEDNKLLPSTRKHLQDEYVKLKEKE